MKTWQIIPLMAALLLSCTREERSTVERFSVGEGASHSGNVRVLAFRTADGLLRAVSQGWGQYVEATLAKGYEYRMYFFGNAPEDFCNGIFSEEEFLRERVLLEEMDTDSPLLYSSPLLYRVLETAPAVLLKRYISRIRIGDISVDWLSSLPQGTECTLETIAVLNAAGSTPVNGIPDAVGPWYNKAGVDESLSGTLRNMLLWNGRMEFSPGGTTRAGKVFYCLPNPLQEDRYGLPWSPRRTRLALKLDIGGIVNWYSIDMPAMECGSEYRIDHVVINGPGTVEPDLPLDRKAISFSLRVSPWINEDIQLELNDSES